MVNGRMSKEDHNDLCSFETNLWAGRITRKEYLEKKYRETINPKYTGLEFHKALPGVIIELMEALDDYNTLKQ